MIEENISLSNNSIEKPSVILGFKIEQREISEKLTTTTIAVEHNKKNLEKHGQEIGERIQASQLYIPEYLMSEYIRFGSNILVRSVAENYQEVVDFFTPLETTLSNHVRIALDPSTTNALFGIVFRGYPLVSGAVGASLSLFPLMSLPPPDQPIPRRQFIALAAAGTVGLGIIGSGVIPAVAKNWEAGHQELSAIPNEATFRRAVFAELLQKLGEKIDQVSSKKVNGVVILPGLHMLGVNQFLDNKKAREETLLQFSLLRAIPKLRQSFYTARITNNSLIPGLLNFEI